MAQDIVLSITLRCLNIIGKGATVKNGFINGGIYAQGAFIENVFVSRSIEFGFRLSDNCTLHNVTTNNNYESGINVEGNNSRLYNVTVKDNGNGILVDGNSNQVTNGVIFTGSNNRFISNIVQHIGSDCLFASNGEGIVIKKNTFRRCNRGVRLADVQYSFIADNSFDATSESSIIVSRRDNNVTEIRISGNKITNSGADGIELNSARKTVVDNNIIVNSAGNGIVVDSGLRIRGADGNNVTDNRISLCRTGIHAGLGSNRNRMIKNRASNSTLFDLNDLSANCGSNVWKGNTGKGNIACTQKN